MSFAKFLARFAGKVPDEALKVADEYLTAEKALLGHAEVPRKLSMMERANPHEEAYIHNMYAPESLRLSQKTDSPHRAFYDLVKKLKAQDPSISGFADEVSKTRNLMHDDFWKMLDDFKTKAGGP